MPNSWFHKLREMTRTKKTNTSSSSSPLSSSSSVPSHPRKSYHFARELTSYPAKAALSNTQFSVEPPRKSARRRSTKRHTPPVKTVNSSFSVPVSVMDSPRKSHRYETERKVHCVCQNSIVSQTSTSDNDSVHPEYGSDRSLIPDIDGLDDPPPVRIKASSMGNSDKPLSVKIVRELGFAGDDNRRKGAIRRNPANPSSPGLKLRKNSPRIGSRRIKNRVYSHPGSVLESFAVVKSSNDPKRDFKESMVEMILENNIRESKDLEELLACYLSLNSREYHDLIVHVFKQIWFDFLHVHPN